MHSQLHRARRVLTMLLASVLVAGLGLGLQASDAPPALADTFTPPPAPPTVSNITITSDQPGTFLGMTPAYPRSSEIYTVSADVEAPATLVGLEKVQLCLWLISAEDCTTYDGTNPYDSTNTPDPQTVFIMEWGWDIPAADLDENGERVESPDYESWGEQFTIVDGAGNHYEIFDTESSDYDSGNSNQTPSGSTVDGGDPTSDLTMRVDFSFRISSAMRHSNDWNVRVAAQDTFVREAEVDDSGQEGSAVLEDQLVNYFGSVRTQRTAVSYGPVVVAGNSVVDDQPMGEYTANSQSDITIQATDFTNNSRTLQLGSAAGNGDLNLECTPGETFDASSSDTVFVASSPQTFLDGIPVSLDEAPDAIGNRNASIDSHSCRMTLTSGANVIEPNIEYSNDVTVAIGADELTSPGNLQLVSSPPDQNDRTEVTLTWDKPIAANDTDKTVTQYAVLRDGSAVSLKCAGTTFADGIVDSDLKNQMVCIDENTVAGTTYSYSVQASIDEVGAGTATAQLTTESAGTPTLLADLEDQFSALGTGVTAGEVMTVMNNNDLTVFATPKPGRLAELMGSVYNNTSGNEGVFSRLPFYRTSSSYYLETSEGFTNARHNGHPYMGFVALDSSRRFIGAGVMVMEDYNSTTALRDFFYPSRNRNVAGAVINSGGTVQELTPGQWWFSDNQRAGANGFYSTNRFSNDDGLWGFAAGGPVNGDTPGPGLNSYSSNRFGLQNYNGSDTSDGNLYWGSTTYSGAIMYFFVRYAD